MFFWKHIEAEKEPVEFKMISILKHFVVYLIKSSLLTGRRQERLRSEWMIIALRRSQRRTFKEFSMFSQKGFAKDAGIWTKVLWDSVISVISFSVAV